MTAKAFLRFYGIEVEEIRHYSIREYENGIVGFSLEKDLRK